jgi:hypothetical protein
MRTLEIAHQNTEILDSLFELLNIVVLYTPVFSPDLWQCIMRLPPIPSGVALYNAVFLFHNLMVRDPDRVRVGLDFFVEFGGKLIGAGNGVQTFGTIAVFNSALFACAGPSVPQAYVEALCAAVQGADVHALADEVEAASQFVLSLLRCDAPFVWPRMRGLLEAWFEIADDADCACAVALAWGVMEEGEKAEMLRSVMRMGIAEMLSRDDEQEIEEFENSTHAIQMRALPVLPREQVVALFVHFLSELEVADPEFCATMRVGEFLACGG